MKLRLWELEDLDALLYMDADSEVLGNISAVFSLPTDFAAVLDANKNGYSCAPVPTFNKYPKLISWLAASVKQTIVFLYRQKIRSSSNMGTLH